MATRKGTAAVNDELADVGACPMPSAPKVVKNEVRELSALVPKMRELRDEGKTVPEICDALDLSYHVVNQVMTQSYKMSMDTVEVFERQERLRLGLEQV